jgi:four helix bundle protein
MRTYSFEQLTAWKKARTLVRGIYLLTREFPSEERFGLSSQMRRAAISIPSNLAEGSGRQSAKDQAHFTRIAYGSLMELLSQLILSFDLDFISEGEYIELREQMEELAKILSGLQRSQLRGY